MKQAIILILEKDKKIEKIRKEYGTDIKRFKPHISLVYPFEVKDQKRLSKHIISSIKGIKPFDIEMKKLGKSKKDYYLYLSPIKGKKEIIKLHKSLNSGILSGFENKDMPKYLPHLSIGIFKSRKEINDAVKTLKKKKLRYKAKISSVQLLVLNKNNSIKSLKNFKLG